ncbi:MAG: hypothetical protein FWD17_07170 [Polyangiaceae bacterium]|nr:hypothetical protein [Polyangiaceae bacterium]
MPAHSPLAAVKEKFGDKAKLVEAVQTFVNDDLWVSRTSKDKGLDHVSNAKLLRLHAIFTEVKQKFGTRDKLIDAILEIEKRSKDAGYRQRLAAWPVPRLYDTYKSAAKRAAPEAPSNKPKPQVKAAAPAPAAAKARAAKPAVKKKTAKKTARPAAKKASR